MAREERSRVVEHLDGQPHADVRHVARNSSAAGSEWHAETKTKRVADPGADAAEEHAQPLERQHVERRLCILEA